MKTLMLNMYLNPYLSKKYLQMSLMYVPVITGHLPRSSDVTEFYHCAPIANGEQGPSMATVLASLATATGSERAPMAALTNILAELTDFTQRQAAELRCIAGVDTLAGIADDLH
jgi:hypothetical protein